MDDKKIKLKKGKINLSEIELEAEIPPEALDGHRKIVLEDIKKDFALPGFRRGNVPENMVLANISADRLLQEAADSAIREFYPEIIREAEISPVSHPEITITKLALGNPLEIKIKVGVYPEVDLPNYKKIGKKIWEEREKPVVEEKEIEAVINQIRGMRGIPKADEKDAEPQELTDEDIKKLGDFKDVADFRERLKKNLLEEKLADFDKRARDKMVREIVAESKVELPQLLVGEELGEFQKNFESRLKESGESLDKYFERTKKNPEEAGKEQRDYIERSLKTKFVLSVILEKEKLDVSDADVEREAKAMRNYDAGLSDEAAKTYAKSMLLNEKLFGLLEGKE
jgi:FKBP-type peptidyl-prolyl cis-trans isomerase (trigger factor)